MGMNPNPLFREPLAYLTFFLSFVILRV
jgi:hypothetical protein